MLQSTISTRQTQPSRAVTQSGSNTVQDYEYDTNENRTQLKTTKAGVVTTTDYTYNKKDQILSEKTNAQPAISYSYDANGNLLSKTDGTVQTFDVLNRMTSYKKGTGAASVYTYYPDNTRKSKQIAGGTVVTHLWIGDNRSGQRAHCMIK